MNAMSLRIAGLLLFVLAMGGWALAAGQPPADALDFPPGLETYTDPDNGGIAAILASRVRQAPFNLVATLIFIGAITFLSTLVPDFSAAMKYSVVAGAVAGGGLTIIANAPNPAGLSILKSFFDEEVEPGNIFLAAALPTVILGMTFLIL